jgi:hypothetical protein
MERLRPTGMERRQPTGMERRRLAGIYWNGAPHAPVMYSRLPSVRPTSCGHALCSNSYGPGGTVMRNNSLFVLDWFPRPSRQEPARGGVGFRGVLYFWLVALLEFSRNL